MPHNRWPIWLKICATALTLAVVFTGIWLAISDTLCAVETDDWVLSKNTHGACLEFWLFRYQTNVQTLASSFIGALGLYYVVRQLKEIVAQNKVTQATLEATLQTQADARRQATAKARVGLSRYSKAVTHLWTYAFRFISASSSEAVLDVREIELAQESIVDILPALYNEERTTAWKAFEDDFNEVVSFLVMRNHGFSLEEMKQAVLDAERAPGSDEEIARRAMALSVKILQVRHLFLAP